jgi:hypothetical protein
VCSSERQIGRGQAGEEGGGGEKSRLVEELVWR